MGFAHDLGKLKQLDNYASYSYCIGAFFNFSYSCLGQDNKIISCALDIELKELNIKLRPDNYKLNQQMEVTLDNGNIMHLKVTDCKGSLVFRVQDLNNENLIVEGQYKNLFGVLTELVKISDEWGELIGYTEYKYFRPLPEGIWKYYKEGKLEKIITYKNGVKE